MKRTEIGVLWMAGSAIFFSVHLAILKHASVSLHPFQVSFLRNVVACVGLGIFLLVLRPAPIRNIPLFLLRGALGTAAILALYHANRNAPLALVTLIFHARIFTLAGLARLTLGERIGKARWVAIGVGFAGVAVAIAPQSGAEWSAGVATALAAALLSSGSQVAVKALTEQNSPLTIVTFSQLIFLILSAPLAQPVWVAPAAGEVVLIALATAGSAGAALCAAKSFSLAPAGVVGPVDIVAVVLSAALGYAFFDESPGWNVLFGGLLIFGGIYLMARRP